MTKKLSITLPEETLAEIDRRLPRYASRSAFLQEAVAGYLAHLEKLEADERDLEIINQNAERLNREADDVLTYQADL